MIVKDLGGHSGCKILLCEENGKYFVRKISGSVEYNHRLEKQCLKQKEFKTTTVKVPKILNSGYESNLFYFDMEYVQGITLAKYISKIDVSKISSIADLLVSNIDFNESILNDFNAYLNKINELTDKTLHLNNEYINSALAYLKEYSWIDFSNSFCHGDLTLENIIVRNGELYYIDFLDSFANSWILDIGKLLQDTDCFWSYRKDEKFDVNTRLRLIILKEILLDKIESINKKYVSDAYAALLLNLIRIYPYTTDEQTLVFLDENTNRVLKLLRGEKI